MLKVVKYTFLLLAALLSLFPLLWMLVSATNKSVDVITGRLLPGTYFGGESPRLTGKHEFAPGALEFIA